MPVTYTARNRDLSLSLSGEIDHHTAAFLRSGIDAAFVRQKPKTLILDFSGVTFMDSSGVGLALGRYKKTKETRRFLLLQKGFAGGRNTAANGRLRLYKLDESFSKIAIYQHFI